MIELGNARLSVRRQCELVGLSRSSWYYDCATESADNLRLMRRIDEEYLRHPFKGSRQMSVWLKSQGEAANRKRVQRLRSEEHTSELQSLTNLVCRLLLE